MIRQFLAFVFLIAGQGRILQAATRPGVFEDQRGMNQFDAWLGRPQGVSRGGWFSCAGITGGPRT
jgi:hypothetical protein